MMPSKSRLSQGRRLLAEQLDHLQQILSELGQRLRDRIAEAIGKAVSCVVRGTVRTALGYASPAIRSVPTREAAYWHDHGWSEEDALWLDDAGKLLPGGQPAATPHTVGVTLRSSRLVQMLGWGLRQWGRAPILATLTIMAAAGVVASLRSPVPAASAIAVQSAAELLVLADTASAGVGMLANAMTP
jgi:hypothetical protein